LKHISHFLSDVCTARLLMDKACNTTHGRVS
jgi:hypothetical protein